MAIKVLLVEGSESDARHITEAFKETGGENYRIGTVNNGVDALNYLNKRETNLDSELPGIIILDIKIPKMNGLELLKEIKSSVSLKNIPIVMLTNSNAKTDILDSYEHQANSYIIKPLAMKELIEVIKYIKETWLKKIK